MLSRNGIVLGKRGGRVLFSNRKEHALVVATTQSGKTTCFAYPTLLSWEGSVIAHDPKEEVYAATAPWRQTFSKVVRLAPTSSCSGHYNPLDAIRLKTEQEMRDVQLVSQMHNEPEGDGREKRSGASQHFLELANEALSGLILYGLYTQRARTPAALDALIMQYGFRKIFDQMRTYPHAGIQRSASIVLGTTGRDESSGIFTTTTRTLRLYTDPLVARMTDQSDFTLRDLRERARPMSLYLSIPFGDQERLRVISRLLLRQLLEYCVSKQEGWTHPMLGMIDEVPGLKRLNILTEGLNYFAGSGVRLALITPSMEELMNTYGQHHNFLDGCKINIVFGIGDAKVAKLFSDRVGKHQVTQVRHYGGKTSRERVWEPLLSETALMNLHERYQLVIVGRHKLLVQKAYYKDHALWRARSASCGISS